MRGKSISVDLRLLLIADLLLYLLYIINIVYSTYRAQKPKI